jgi:hypothetical protein
MGTKASTSPWSMAASKSLGNNMIGLSLHDDAEKFPKTITVLKTKTLRQIVQDLKMPQASIHSITFYGKVINPDTLIQDLPVTDWGPAPLVINHVRDGPSPLQQEMAKKRLLYCRIVNEAISKHWETFSHSTCGILGYVAAILEAELPGVQMTRKLVEGRVNDMVQQNQSVENLIKYFFCWDTAAGDCGASHVVLMKTLKANQELSDVRWRIYQGGGHGLLVGILFDGSLLVIDVGTLRECVQFSGDGLINYVSLLGKNLGHSEPKAEFQYYKNSRNFAQLAMKAFHL